MHRIFDGKYFILGSQYRFEIFEGSDEMQFGVGRKVGPENIPIAYKSLIILIVSNTLDTSLLAFTGGTSLMQVLLTLIYSIFRRTRQ